MSATLTDPVSNALRKHAIKSKPRLHDGTVMVDLDKNKLVEIPPNGGESPDDSLRKDLTLALNG